MSVTAIVLLSAAALVILGLALSWRGARQVARRVESERDELAAAREELTARLARETQARKKQSDELADLRKRADKARKRSARAERGGADLPLGTAARVSDLEAQVERTERERDRSRAEREQLAAQIQQLEARLAAASRPAPTVASPVAAPSGSAGSTDLGASLAEANERARKLEDALESAKQVELRMRKRMSNQEQLYASMRAELDVKKDRLRAQEERIQRLEALAVVVQD